VYCGKTADWIDMPFVVHGSGWQGTMRVVTFLSVRDKKYVGGPIDPPHPGEARPYTARYSSCLMQTLHFSNAVFVLCVAVYCILYYSPCHAVLSSLANDAYEISLKYYFELTFIPTFL